MLSMKAYLNASEVAKLLNVDRATVTRWIKKGIIKNAVRVGKTQQWRIPLASYEEIVRNKQHESH
jgi:excisionase family DNA binding protein